jgi:hypothetical protein
MKFILTFFIVFSMGVTLIGIAATASEKPAENKSPAWEIPVAAGVWYPGDGEIPEKPMRYYRARCFPGCHVGSRYGMFPNTPLESDAPIWPTSTIDRVAGGGMKRK